MAPSEFEELREYVLREYGEHGQQTITEIEAHTTDTVDRLAHLRSFVSTMEEIGPAPPRAGAAGVVAGEGSSLLAELDYATDAELEAQGIRYGYSLSERAKRIDAQFSKYQAGQINPEMAAGISLLSSAGSIATNYYRDKPIGDTTQRNGGLYGAAARDSYGQER